ncbi:MAG: flavodoxin domain-containing protein [Bacteroidales bacterium]|nr:flavodoxin domain-containing protein [Bacteroidales bacterium]
MGTLIAYSSTLGCTEQCVSRLKGDLGPGVDLYRISRRRKINFSKYRTVIIGGSIHEGMIQRAVRSFCETNLKELLKVEVGLFICCVDPGENEDELLKEVFPDKLLGHALAKSYFGGELNFKKMNLMQKIMTRKKERLEVMPEIDFDRILAFAERLQERNA